MTRLASSVDILADLVAIPSVSTMSNRPVIEYALGYLDSNQWHVTQHTYRDAAGVEKANLIAASKQGGLKQDGPTDVELALVCHTDTVPFEASWRDAVNPVLRDGKLYGRGSCDVKGFLACVLAAVTGIDVRQFTRRLAIVLTADEEVGCIGAKHLVEGKTFRSRYAIVGEPTGLRAVHGGKGYGLAEIVVRGREAHSAFPERGRSAIRDAARILERLDSVSEQLASVKNLDFDPPYTTLNVGLIEGGTAKNIVPGECRITVEWRPIPGQDAGWAASLVEEQFARLATEFSGFEAHLEIKRLDSAFNAGESRTLVALIESLTAQAATAVSFGTEAAHIARLASEVIVFGPGDMTVAHKTGEFVPVHELRECEGHLKAVIERLCGA